MTLLNPLSYPFFMTNARFSNSQLSAGKMAEGEKLHLQPQNAGCNCKNANSSTLRQDFVYSVETRQTLCGITMKASRVVKLVLYRLQQ